MKDDKKIEITPLKERLIGILMDGMGGVAPDSIVRERLRAYTEMNVGDLLDLIERRLIAAQARTGALRDALQIVVSKGRRLDGRRG